MSYWDHIEQAYQKTSIYDGGTTFQYEFARLPAHVGDLLAAHWILSEIANGGLHQFFANPTGVLAPEAAQGFERMGLPDVADVIRRAMAQFHGTYPREQQDRESFLAFHGPEVFGPLEEQLYEIGSPNLGCIYDIMDEYAIRNAESNAAPNGGPAASVYNSNAPGGPPSVS